MGQWLPPPDQGPKPIKKSAIQHGLVNGSDIVGWTGVVGFNLELADGSSHAIRSARGNFAQHIGSRIWVTENPDGSLREYGVL